jgi:hypothetical protein
MHVNSRVASWLVAAALALGASTANAQGILAQTQSNGAWGGLYGRDAAHAVTAYVSRTLSASGETQTFLFFEIDEPYSGYPWGTTNVLFGSGLIPNGDLVTDGLGQLILDTDTTSNVAFTTYACPNPPDAGTCGPVANGGRVQMTLSRSNATSILRNSGQWTFQWGNTLITQVGNGQFASATGTGSVAGIAFPDGSTGGIGMNESVYVVIQQGQ